MVTSNHDYILVCNYCTFKPLFTVHFALSHDCCDRMLVYAAYCLPHLYVPMYGDDCTADVLLHTCVMYYVTRVAGVMLKWA